MTVVAASAVVDACAKAERPDLASDWFDKKGDSDFAKVTVHKDFSHNSVVHAYARVGRVDEAVKWLT